MNFLAHFYLAGPEPEALVGQWLGDFVRGRDLSRFAEPVRRGIRLHRRIDACADAHPLFRQSRTRIDGARRRYAGVLVDLFYDHFLARHWADYSPLPLDRFCAGVYDVLARASAGLPEPSRAAAERMIAQDWLRSYAEIDGIAVALDRIALRLPPERRHACRLAEGIADLRAGYALFEEEFAAFFPELIRQIGAPWERPAPGPAPAAPLQTSRGPAGPSGIGAPSPASP